MTSQHLEWVSVISSIQAGDAICKAIEKKITVQEKVLERESEILKWVSSFDVRSTHEGVLEITKMNGEYRRHGQWLIDHSHFENWRTLSTYSTLWLNGTIGTGKTTLMARASLDLQEDGQTDRLALFFFQKGEGIVKAQMCLQSILRQLSWNRPKGQVEPSISAAYEDSKEIRHNLNDLKSRECVKLLRHLVREKECYVLIDGLDECEDYSLLLDRLQELQRPSLEQESDERGLLHVMVGSRDDLFCVKESFLDCLVITTREEYSKRDQKFYIREELKEQRKLRPGSLFFTSEENFADQLQAILVKKGGGLFRWIQIQIEIFSRSFFRTADEIEDEIVQVKQRSSHPDLEEEYSRLLKLRGRSGHSRRRAIQMLQFLICALEPLSFADLGEAVSEGKITARKVRADDARRILVGFVTESHFSNSTVDEEMLEARSAVRLAHASVRDFLEDHVVDENGFSIIAQNAQAAALCLSCLNRKHANMSTPVRTVDESGTDLSLRGGNSREIVLGHFATYCYYAWYVHIIRAVERGSREISPFIERLSAFIHSGAYLIWARSPRRPFRNWGIHLPKAAAPWRLFYLMETDEFRKTTIVNTGFLVAALDLPEL